MSTCIILPLRLLEKYIQRTNDEQTQEINKQIHEQCGAIRFQAQAIDEKRDNQFEETKVATSAIGKQASEHHTESMEAISNLQSNNEEALTKVDAKQDERHVETQETLAKQSNEIAEQRKEIVELTAIVIQSSKKMDRVLAEKDNSGGDGSNGGKVEVSRDLFNAGEEHNNNTADTETANQNGNHGPPDVISIGSSTNNSVFTHSTKGGGVDGRSLDASASASQSIKSKTTTTTAATTKTTSTIGSENRNPNTSNSMLSRHARRQRQSGIVRPCPSKCSSRAMAKSQEQSEKSIKMGEKLNGLSEKRRMADEQQRIDNPLNENARPTSRRITRSSKK